MRGLDEPRSFEAVPDPVCMALIDKSLHGFSVVHLANEFGCIGNRLLTVALASKIVLDRMEEIDRVHFKEKWG